MRAQRGKGNCDLLNRSYFPPMGLKEPPGNYSSGGSLVLSSKKVRKSQGVRGAALSPRKGNKMINKSY
jgi:hypothetical protein